MRIPRFFGLHAEPSRWLRWALAVVPFVLLGGLYLNASHVRLTENPDDKLLPSVSKMADSVQRMAFTADKRTGDYLLWKDTFSSLRRIGVGVGLAALVGLWLGINVGLFPGFRSMLLPFVTFVSIIPPLAILPILFISFGVGEVAKVVLIFVGTVFIITRDIYLAVRGLPRQQLTKALTLGASQTAVVYRVVLPQILPRLLDTMRLSLGAAWLFLIASEAVASTDGLGYRIFLVRRYLSMDVIIPYVLWITLIGFSMDWILRSIVSRRFAWYVESKR